MILQATSPLLDGLTRQARICTWQPGKRGTPVLMFKGDGREYAVESGNAILDEYAVLSATPEEMEQLARGGYILEGVDLNLAG